MRFEVDWKKMNLHGCKENEFNCRSGDCVDLKERCDQNLDCRDGSDEQNCIIYIKDANYEESITPPPTKGKELMEINISITIYDIIGVNEGESKFAARFTLNPILVISSAMSVIKCGERALMHALAMEEVI